MPNKLINIRRDRVPGHIPGVKPYSPPYLTGILGWWMADAGCSTSAPAACVNNDTIATVADQSGNGYTLSNSGSPKFQTNQLNGLPGMFFDGSSYFTQATILGGGNFSGNVGSLMAVYRPGTPTLTQYMTFLGSASDGIWYFSGDTNGYLADFRSARVAGYPTAMPGTNNNLIAIVSGASNYFCRINRVTKSNQATAFAVTTTFMLGTMNGGNNYQGYFFEFMLYNTELTSDQIIQNEAYLNSKWGV